MHKMVKLWVEMKEECLALLITLRRTPEEDDFWCGKGFLAAGLRLVERGLRENVWWKWLKMRENEKEVRV